MSYGHKRDKFSSIINDLVLHRSAEDVLCILVELRNVLP